MLVFGSINIDAELVVGVEGDGAVINLANGCVCCNIRDDLVAAVTQVITRPERPEYILLEASGVADPSGIALTFMDEGMRDRVRLDSIMCRGCGAGIRGTGVLELKPPVAFADMLILNKVDLVTPEIERIKAWLDDRFHRYRLVQASRGDVPLEILLSVGRFDPARFDGTAPHDRPIIFRLQRSDCGITSLTIGTITQKFLTELQAEEPLSLEALRERAQAPGQHLPMQRRRSCAEEPDRQVILRVVGKRVDIEVGDAWNGSPGPG